MAAQSLGLKGVAEIRAQFERMYARIWAGELAGVGTTSWPYAMRVGRPAQRELEQDYAGIRAQADALVAWATARGLSYATEPRKVGRMAYPLLSHVVAPSMDALAHAVGKSGHLASYRERVATLRELFPGVGADGIRSVLVALNRCEATDADFELVCAAAQWFTAHDAAGFSPREVPLEGFHAKWLDGAGHRKMICTLAGLSAIELRERPHLVRFTYLDPSYLAGGVRVHDTWLEGDAGVPAYVPTTVIICENRDSALWFPPLEGAIAVMGDGMAGTATVAGISWVAQASHLLYWGDIDVAGFQILATYRQRGLRVQSVLMDRETYDAYERFGTMEDAHGRALRPQPNARPLEGLTPQENALYMELCSPELVGPRRVEQERIPLEVALAVCRQAT